MRIHPCPFQFSRMGSNHDRLNQNQKCYHYTTGKYGKYTTYDSINQQVLVSPTLYMQFPICLFT